MDLKTADMLIYPGIAETLTGDNRTVSDHPTPNIRAVGTIAGATTISMTYSFSGRWLR